MAKTRPALSNSAVVFCGNHPNSLLAPVLITAWCGRVVHLAAKDVLFSVPILGALLRLMAACPLDVARIMVAERKAPTSPASQR